MTRQHWKKKVEPHLDSPIVRWAQDLGMKHLHPGWKSGDPRPRGMGSVQADREGEAVVVLTRRSVPLDRLLRLCHRPAELPRPPWGITTGDRHTVAVGYVLAGTTP